MSMRSRSLEGASAARLRRAERGGPGSVSGSEPDPVRSSKGPSLRLPTGMRDFAPRAAAARRKIAETLLGVFEMWGFARVITPAFEYEETLALGLGGAGRAAAIRFVEPSSGQVVALRPDITPQVARLIATRFADEPGAVRLCYEGTVVRLE